MIWLRLTLRCRSACLDDLKDLLEKFSPESISYSPASADVIFGDGIETQGFWELTSVSVLFNPDIDLDILLACIRGRLGDENIDACKIDRVKDREWQDSHKSGTGPMIFGDRLCVCPSWCEPPDGSFSILILDPGLAFGTGTHATTALCLDWLARQSLDGYRIIDYGCGSGILALAAAKLGAGSVTAIDIDPQALLATSNNACRNGMEGRVKVLNDEGIGLDSADILIANILLRPLLELAPRFKDLLDQGGRLALSGLLATQTEECMAAYRPWFEFDMPDYRDEWAILTGLRNKSI